MAVQRPTFEVRIAGRVVPGVTDVQVSSGFEQINAEASVTALSRPSWADEGSAVTIWASNNGHAGQIFGGEVAGFDWTYASTSCRIVCRDLLARTREPWGGEEAEYTDQAAAAIIRNLLEKKAIPSSVANIEDSDILPNLGIVEPIVLKEGDTPYSIIESIDRLDGYRTYTTPAGTIFRRRVGGQIGISAALTFERGVVMLAAPHRNRTKVGIINRVVITGVTYEGLSVGGVGVGEASAANPYVDDPSGFITETTQSNLVEDDDTALAVARRRVEDKNRRPETITFEAPLDPRPQPAMTIGVIHPDLEMGSALVLAQTISHSINAAGAKTTITAIGGAISGPAQSPPVAQFNVSMFLEGEDDGAGNVTPRIIVVADGTTSYDPDGEIASYDWAASGTGGTPDPATGDTALFRTTIDGAATEIALTLTVTDNDGQEGALTLATPIDTTTMLIEDISLAYGDVAYSSDGQQTWRTATPASGSATCLSPFAPSWGQVWGTDTGHIYATFDKLVSDLVDLGAPHGAVGCTAVWVHELDTTRLWAGFDDGDVWYAALDLTAQTATWTQRGTIAEGPVVEIRESIGLLNELRATAGTSYYYSTTGGASWAQVDTGDAAWRMAAGFDQNAYSFLNDAEPLRFEDGHSITLPSIFPAVEHVRGLSFGWREQILYAADDQARLFTSVTPFTDLLEHADTTPAIVNHMIRSGNEDGVVYLACGDGTGTNGAYKWIPGAAAPFSIRDTDTGQCYMIGYGALHAPPVIASLLIVDAGASAASPAGVWRYAGATWTHLTDGLPTLPSGSEPSDNYWAGIVADPGDSNNHWLLWDRFGRNVYITDDAGGTWSHITDASTGGGWGVAGNSGWLGATFAADGSGEWTLTGLAVDTFAAEHAMVLMHGSGTTVTNTATWRATAIINPIVGDRSWGIVAGIGDNVLGGVGDGTWDTRIYRAPFDTDAFDDLTASNTVSDHPRLTSIDRGYGGNKIVIAVSNGVGTGYSVFYTSPDYSAASPVLNEVDFGEDVINASVAMTIDGTAYIGHEDGVTQVQNPAGSPTVTDLATDFGDTETVYWIRSDRRTQTVVAALCSGVKAPPTGGMDTNGGYVAVLTGGAWIKVRLPNNDDVANTFASWIEVIG